MRGNRGCLIDSALGVSDRAAYHYRSAYPDGNSWVLRKRAYHRVWRSEAWRCRPYAERPGV